MEFGLESSAGKRLGGIDVLVELYLTMSSLHYA